MTPVQQEVLDIEYLLSTGKTKQANLLMEAFILVHGFVPSTK